MNEGIPVYLKYNLNHSSRIHKDKTVQLDIKAFQKRIVSTPLSKESIES